MQDLFENLKTASFADYLSALEKLRTELDDESDLKGLNDGDFFHLLRPYCWFMHNPGFQDIYDTCLEAIETYQKYQDDLMEETNMMMGNEFLAVNTFLASYLENESYNTSKWKMLFASGEIATVTAADKYAEKLDSINKEAAAVSRKLAALMRNIEGSKHVAYHCLRSMGNQCLGLLQAIMHKFSSDDQSYILHALDAFPKDKAVISFYKTFIEKTTYDYLVEEAEKYLERVDV